MPEDQEIRERFESAGQGQVFAHWDQLSLSEREGLIAEAAEVDLAEVGDLVQALVFVSASEVDLSGLEPAPYIALPEHGGDAAAWEHAKATGTEALRAGRVALFTVAGGQGTRLGYDGPKGTFPVTPVTGKSLFGVFAGKVRGASEAFGVDIPWFIMTSTANHEATIAHFEEQGYFGLPRESVMFFSQGRMPAVDFDGKILLADKGTLAMSPNGHGGSLRALVRSGAIAQMRERGVDIISYFQVDNPLVKAVDPAFIGFHVEGKSAMSSKMVPKAYPLEKLGHFCRQDGKTVVIEYSDMPDAMQEETTPSGELRYNAGSIAIHVLDTGFVEKVGGAGAEINLPFHKAKKKIPCIDAAGNAVFPKEPNGIKFEMFVFDALPFAENPVIIETARTDDFSPVKNAEGTDSPESCRRDQLAMWTRWLKAAGVTITTDGKGNPPFNFEVSSAFADDCETFVRNWNALAKKPTITEGTVIA